MSCWWKRRDKRVLADDHQRGSRFALAPGGPPWQSIPKVRARIDGPTADQDLVVQVRARGAPGVAGVADERPTLHALARLHAELRQVAVEGADVLAVVDDDRRPVILRVAGVDHGPRRRRVDRCTARGPDVDAGVELALVRPGRLPVAEFGVHGAPHGPPRGQRGQRPAGARHELLERAQALGLLTHRLAQEVELVAGRQAGPLRVSLRRAADTPVAAP